MNPQNVSFQSLRVRAQLFCTKTSACLLTSLASIVVFASFGPAAPIEEGQLYKLTELGTLAEKKMSIPTAINQKGQIAGVSSAGPSTEAAFCYHPGPGTMESVASKPATWLTRAFGLNDVGQVVGDSTFGEGDGKTAPVRQAALFVNGSSASLVGVMDPNVETRAMDINNSGVAVGFSGPDSGGAANRAFAWTASTGRFDLGTLGGSSARALAINNAGVITGHSEVDGDAGTPWGSTHAFIILPSHSGQAGMIDLGTLGGDFSYGIAISENGQVAGYSTIDATYGLIHAFLYQDGKMRDLRIPWRQGRQDRPELCHGRQQRRPGGRLCLPFAGGGHATGSLRLSRRRHAGPESR